MKKLFLSVFTVSFLFFASASIAATVKKVPCDLSSPETEKDALLLNAPPPPKTALNDGSSATDSTCDISSLWVEVPSLGGALGGFLDFDFSFDSILTSLTDMLSGIMCDMIGDAMDLLGGKIESSYSELEVVDYTGDIMGIMESDLEGEIIDMTDDAVRGALQDQFEALYD